MFCQIRISDVLRLIKFQFYGRFRPYEQFVSGDLFPRTIHLEIPYGCTGIRTEVFGSCFCDNLRWQRWRVTNTVLGTWGLRITIALLVHQNYNVTFRLNILIFFSSFVDK